MDSGGGSRNSMEFRAKRRFAGNPQSERMRFFAVFGGANLKLTCPIPKGLSPPGQGCEERATLGNPERSLLNPNGVVAQIAVVGHNPVGVGTFARCGPRVARSSQPWALSQNPFGIRTHGSAGI